MLWAWERPDDLEGIDTARVGVAYLAKTLQLGQDDVAVLNRRQPLRLPADAYRIPVVRIETAPRTTPMLSPAQARRVIDEITALARPGTPAVQIDYDAAYSQRSFYAGIAAGVRGGLPADVRLSITALASWTLFDRWIDALPVDEAVPMLFRMGADSEAVRRHLRLGGGIRATRAAGHLGIATDEPLAGLPAGRHVWIFSSRTWTPEAAQRAISEVTRWQGTVSCPSS